MMLLDLVVLYSISLFWCENG